MTGCGDIGRNPTKKFPVQKARIPAYAGVGEGEGGGLQDGFFVLNRRRELSFVADTVTPATRIFSVGARASLGAGLCNVCVQRRVARNSIRRSAVSLNNGWCVTRSDLGPISRPRNLDGTLNRPHGPLEFLLVRLGAGNVVASTVEEDLPDAGVAELGECLMDARLVGRACRRPHVHSRDSQHNAIDGGVQAPNDTRLDRVWVDGWRGAEEDGALEATERAVSRVLDEQHGGDGAALRESHQAMEGPLAGHNVGKAVPQRSILVGIRAVVNVAEELVRNIGSTCIGQAN